MVESWGVLVLENAQDAVISQKGKVLRCIAGAVSLSMATIDVKYDHSDSDKESICSDVPVPDDDALSSSGEEVKSVSSGRGEEAKTGLADVFAKILGKKVPKRKNPVLAKGKTDKEIKRQKLSKKKDSCSGSESKASDSSENDETQKNGCVHQKRKEWAELGRVKPSIFEKEREKTLQRIATRGVVQLFNAVRQQQNILGDKLAQAGSSVRHREKAVGSMTKKNFLDLLDSKAPVAKLKGAKKGKSKDGQSWSVLCDDYMLGARMKDFDKDSDDGGGGHSDEDF